MQGILAEGHFFFQFAVLVVDAGGAFFIVFYPGFFFPEPSFGSVVFPGARRFSMLVESFEEGLSPVMVLLIGSVKQSFLIVLFEPPAAVEIVEAYGTFVVSAGIGCFHFLLSVKVKEFVFSTTLAGGYGMGALSVGVLAVNSFQPSAPELFFKVELSILMIVLGISFEAVVAVREAGSDVTLFIIAHPIAVRIIIEEPAC